MTPAWTLRRYETEDEDAILELLNAAFGKWHSPEYWRWKYTRNPAGPPIIWLAEHNNKIIGHYGITPIRMKIGNAYVRGSFADDAATHPDYQGRGVFSSIVNRSYLDAGQGGIPITFGFANTNLGPTYKRYERIGHICFMIAMTKVFDWEPFLAKYAQNKRLIRAASAVLRRIRRPRSSRGDLRIETIDRFDERSDVFWERVCRNFQVVVRRDQTYLNWRYVGHPEKEYTIRAAVEGRRFLGYSVLARQRRDNLSLGLIVDILGFQDHRDVVGHLIDDAVRCFEQQNVHGVSSAISEMHPYGSLFWKAGFIRHPHRNLALHSAVNLPGSPIDERQVYSQAILLSRNCLLKEKANWFMTYADDL